MRHRHYHGCLGALYGQRESVELEFQDWLVLRRSRFHFNSWNVVPYARNQGVCTSKCLREAVSNFANFQSSRRSVAEIDELFERKIKAWRFAKTETATQRLLKAENTSMVP